MWEKIESRVAQISQLAIWVPLRILFFFFGRLEVRNWDVIQRLPKDAFIAVSNHMSFLDMFLICHLFPFSTGFFPFRYLVDPTHYYTWKQPFMWALGAYPVFKGEGLEIALQKSLNILEREERILLFPEEKIKRKGKQKHPRRGIAYLAAKTSLRILPCYLEGLYPIRYRMGFTWKDLFLRRYQLRVTFGKPFFIQDVYGKVPETMQEYREAAEKVMEKVYELKALRITNKYEYTNS